MHESPKTLLGAQEGGREDPTTEGEGKALGVVGAAGWSQQCTGMRGLAGPLQAQMGQVRPWPDRHLRTNPSVRSQLLGSRTELL